MNGGGGINGGAMNGGGGRNCKGGKPPPGISEPVGSNKIGDGAFKSLARPSVELWPKNKCMMERSKNKLMARLRLCRSLVPLLPPASEVNFRRSALASDRASSKRRST